MIDRPAPNEREVARYVRGFLDTWTDDPDFRRAVLVEVLAAIDQGDSAAARPPVMIEARNLLQGMVDSRTLPIAYRNAALDVLNGRLPFADGEPAPDNYSAFLVAAVAIIGEYRAVYGSLPPRGK